MTLQEAGHCHGELGKVRAAEQERMKRQEEFERREAERKRQEELKKQEELRKKEEERQQRQGWLIDNNNGTVSDPKTGLMWAAEDNGFDINWDDAKAYCESFRGGGHRDWRMPKTNELKQLFESGSGYEDSYGNNVYISEFIRLTSCNVWVLDAKDYGSEVPIFDFSEGPWQCHRSGYEYNERALPVRAGK
ncbi:MAG: DUF1566 domain-containing protein [Thermodesulfobacteriota bacterium]